MINHDLLNWWRAAGKDGREKLRQATGATPPVLNNYVYGRRKPPLKIARIISEVTGIDIDTIPYRYVHEPLRQ